MTSTDVPAPPAQGWANRKAESRTSSPVVAETFKGSIVPSVGSITCAEWTALFPGEVEGWDYFVACEAAPPPGFTLEAAVVREGGRVIAAVPAFRHMYRLDTPLQGRTRAFTDWLHRLRPNCLSLGIVALGSPLSDHCPVGFAAELTAEQRLRAMEALIAALDEHVRASGADILAVKDVTASRHLQVIDSALQTARFVRLPSLPVAELDLPFASEEGYLATLSAATRKDIRRKLRRADEIRVEMRSGPSGIEKELVSLFEGTRAQSKLDYGDFTALSPDYFEEVLRHMGDRALLVLYWKGTCLLAFNLLLVESDRLIDKFMGMRYPDARHNNIWALSWMTNVRFCLDHGIRRLETGRAAYLGKVRFGSELQEAWVYCKHRIPLVNHLFRIFGPLVAFDSNNPELDAVRARQARRSPG